MRLGWCARGSVVIARIACGVVLAVLLSGCAQQTAVEKTKHALALHDEASALYQAKDCNAALRAYRHIVEQYPAGAEAWYRIGNCHARLKQRDAAVAAYHEALMLSPDYGKAWHNLAYVEAQALVDTLNRMNKQLKEADPARQRVAKLLRQILAVSAAQYPAGDPLPAVPSPRISERH